jgi:hypothetical protein
MMEIEKEELTAFAAAAKLEKKGINLEIIDLIPRFLSARCWRNFTCPMRRI